MLLCFQVIYNQSFLLSNINNYILNPKQFWGEVTQLNFRQVSPYSKADIDIKFVVVNITSDS